MNKLLIVVDMINDFCHKDGVLAKSIVTGEYYGMDIVSKVYHKVQIYRDSNTPIIWLFDNHDKDDKEFKLFPPHAIKGTWGAQIVEELDPEHIKKSGSEISMAKTRYSGFFNTSLEFQLCRLNPGTVEVCGVCTSICVMDTVGGLANRDYKTIVEEDCVADFSALNHTNAIDRMASLYGAIIL